MKYKLITLIFACTFALQCSAQWHIIMSIKCHDYNNYVLSKAILEVCGEDFVNDVLLMQRAVRVTAFISHDSLGNVDNIRIITNRIQIDDDDLIHIKQYIIGNNMKVASCPGPEDYFERPDGIRRICSEQGRNQYKRKNGLYESLVVFPGYHPYTLFFECDSSEMLARYLEWMDGNSYPNCLPMCEPCGCNTMNEMSNDYIFQQLASGDLMTYQLLNEYIHQTEDVKQKFLFELSHPLHAKADVIEECAKNIAESLVLSDYEKERMLKALKK